MSEIKRAALLPLGPQKGPDRSSKKEPRKTVRISVKLPKSNEDTCLEYNYKDELAIAKKLEKYKTSGNANSNHNNQLLLSNGHGELSEDNDDDVRRLARQMEEKYGTGVGGVSLNKKKRKIRKDDYADIGMGYDESDSFIDNTDGYDEIIPQNVTTLHGGFYINSGALVFKTDDEASSDSDSSSASSSGSSQTEIGKKASRKRVIESSDDDDDGDDDDDETDRENKTDSNLHHQDKKRRLLQNGSNGMIQSSMKKKMLAQSKIYIKKRRPIDPLKKTVKELLRERREDLNMSVPEELERTLIQVEDDKNNKDSINSKKNTMSIANVTDSIESVVKAAATTSNNNNNNNNKVSKLLSENDDRMEIIIDNNIKEVVEGTSSNLLLPFDGGNVESSHETTSTNNINNNNNININNKEKIDVVIKLPENLPSDIVAIINTIKTASTSAEGKVKFFTSETNNMLLKLERSCKCLGKPSKTKVLEHLSQFIKCKKETLIRRTNQLVLEDDQKKLKILLANLRTEITDIMPSLLLSHEKESKRVIEKKFSRENLDFEDIKSLRMPKRRFQWTDTTRKMLKDILTLKKRLMMCDDKQRDDLEQQMNGFLKNELQLLWPDGWMSLHALQKVYYAIGEQKQQQQRTLLNNNPNNTVKSILPSVAPNLPPQCLINNSNLSITPIVNNNNISSATGSSGVDARNSIDLTVTSQNSDISIAVASTRSLSPNKNELFLPDKQQKLLKTATSSSSSDLFNKTASMIKNNNTKIINNPDPIQINRLINSDKSVEIIDNNNAIKIESYQNEVINLSDTKDLLQQRVVSENKVGTSSSNCYQNNQVINLCDDNKETTATKRHHNHPEVIKVKKHVLFSKEPDAIISTITSGTSSSTSSSTGNKRHLVDVSSLGAVANNNNSKSSTKQHEHHRATVKNSSINNNTMLSTAATTSSTSSSDDIKKVMEDLKMLEKLSSPKKIVPNHHSSVVDNNHQHHQHHGGGGGSATAAAAAVSVIAVNKSFTPKTLLHQNSSNSSNNNNNNSIINNSGGSSSNTTTRTDYNLGQTTKSDFSTGFQDEFQKQVFSFSALNHMSSTPKSNNNYNNSIDKSLQLSNTGGSTMGSSDKYFQNISAGGYSSNLNGHKSTSSKQAGSTSKSQQK